MLLYKNVVQFFLQDIHMGKTFRRGGSEQGYYYGGKSLRDKRQKGTNRSSFREESYDYDRSKKGNNKSRDQRTYDEFEGGVT